VRRREFIKFLGGAAAWPLTARAQQPATPTIGYLSTRSPGEAKYVTDALTRGLNETGYVEGRNLAIEFRWAEL
jgi:putative ABC transport system substrate-binding protein